ncbi:hypothetical protein [Microbacterium gilvum]|uniref:DNA-directed RNA polymerase subunit omega n=1 Tax=Microbacterium gilvum TaxID=1336204 RepID=A0ABP8ZPN1_9MICO
MTVQFSGQRPGAELNGLEDLHDDLMKADAEDVLVVGIVRRAKRVLNDEKDEQYPVVRFARVEPVLDDAGRKTVQQLLDQAYRARTGNEALDLPEVEGE